MKVKLEEIVEISFQLHAQTESVFDTWMLIKNLPSE